MDISKIQSLIAQGRVITDITDINPNETFVQVGVYQPNNRKIGSGENTYPPFAIALSELQSLLNNTDVVQFAASDETTALTTGTNKITFRMPYGMNLTEVRASLVTAQTSGTIFTVDIKQNGVSILSTLLTIDNGERTSTTASTPAVISTSNLIDDSRITVDITQIGDGTATGLKVLLKGTKI
jgi:hypothetical protein